VGIEDAVEVAAGGETACARLRDDSIRCWGSNTRGQLGNGDRKDRDKPTPVLLSPTGT
jgi:alpha-tubulin suppressor-like RCC1 family protein